MKRHKKYLQPFDMLLNAIHDLAGLQKAETVICDSPRGIVNLQVALYGIEREYRFYVDGLGCGTCTVTIELEGDGDETRRLIDHEFALLDYVLVDRAKIELAEIEEHDRRILEERKDRSKSGSETDYEDLDDQ